MTRIEKEKHIIGIMIDIYCKKKHKHKDGLCEECQELLSYSRQRLDKCRFGEEKSYCQKCPIHCYKKSMKVKIKDVMKFSGPRLLLYRPVEFFKHMFSR
ncbi:nitrous oxide-stimulated promoter family protein [Intestinibacter sp.]